MRLDYFQILWFWWVSIFLKAILLNLLLANLQKFRILLNFNKTLIKETYISWHAPCCFMVTILFLKSYVIGAASGMVLYIIQHVLVAFFFFFAYVTNVGDWVWRRSWEFFVLKIFMIAMSKTEFEVHSGIFLF